MALYALLTYYPSHIFFFNSMCLSLCMGHDLHVESEDSFQEWVFSSSTMWVLGIELTLPGLAAGASTTGNSLSESPSHAW